LWGSGMPIYSTLVCRHALPFRPARWSLSRTWALPEPIDLDRLIIDLSFETNEHRELFPSRKP